MAKGVRAGGRAAGVALAKLAAAAPPGDPSLQATLEVRVVSMVRPGPRRSPMGYKGFSLCTPGDPSLQATLKVKALESPSW